MLTTRRSLRRWLPALLALVVLLPMRGSETIPAAFEIEAFEPPAPRAWFATRLSAPLSPPAPQLREAPPEVASTSGESVALEAASVSSRTPPARDPVPPPAPGTDSAPVHASETSPDPQPGPDPQNSPDPDPDTNADAGSPDDAVALPGPREGESVASLSASVSLLGGVSVHVGLSWG